eukprot:1141341-Pelagomonas_calceolata.AAC.1
MHGSCAGSSQRRRKGSSKASASSSGSGDEELEDFIVCRPDRDYAALLRSARFRQGGSDDSSGSDMECPSVPRWVKTLHLPVSENSRSPSFHAGNQLAPASPARDIAMIQ